MEGYGREESRRLLDRAPFGPPIAPICEGPPRESLPSFTRAGEGWGVNPEFMAGGRTGEQPSRG